MFETESIEQANKKYPIPKVCNELDVARNRKYEEGFKDGAEFGYNKANNWHYPSKGEYPKDQKYVLCILGDFENDNLEIGYYSKKENVKERWRFEEFSTPDDSEEGWGVSAWKEIVLPELPKEIDE